MANSKIINFLSGYNENVSALGLALREDLIKNLPNIQEQLDVKARLIGYGYGPKYVDTICVIILSKTGIKLGFYKGTELPDPAKLFKGAGKVHKHVEIKSVSDIKSADFKKLLLAALKAYKERTKM